MAARLQYGRAPLLPGIEPDGTITNEARFGFARNTPLFFNNEKFEVGYILSLPLITNPIQNFLQQGRVPTNYDYIDNATWVIGKHCLEVWRHLPSKSGPEL